MCILATRKVYGCMEFRVLNNWSQFICRNSWSDEGVQTIIIDNDVECRAAHLTSFAVIVSTQGNSQSCTSVGSVIFISCYIVCYWRHYMFQSLRTVSYIGCGISIFSLLLTMFAIVYWRYVFSYTFAYTCMPIVHHGWQK